MAISVRPVRYESDSRELVDTLQRNLPHLPHAKLFPWLYLENPEGRAVTWVAIDPATNGIVGVAAAFPRRVYYRGGEVRGYVLGDFCIDANHRSLGLALTLQRALMDALSKGDGGFVFDFPSSTMLAIYKRMRIEVSAGMIRYAKPLRVDSKVAARVPVRAVARGLSVVANAGLKLRDDTMRREGDWTIAVEPGPWGEDFTQATREWASHTGVSVARTAGYLNWRYREHPLQTYEMFSARKGGILHGYLIYQRGEVECNIDDLFAADDAVRKALLAEATAAARKHAVQTLSMPWLSLHPGRKLLEECGFKPRESSPVVLLPLAGIQATNDWYLTRGDWES